MLIENGLQGSHPGLEMIDIATLPRLKDALANGGVSTLSYLRGTSIFVTGSYPMQGAPTFSQLAQVGSRWSQRCFLIRQRLQVLRLRKFKSTDLMACRRGAGKCVGFPARDSYEAGEDAPGSSRRLRLKDLDIFPVASGSI